MLLYISTKFPCGRAMNSAIDYKLTLTWPLPGGSFVHVTTFYFWLRTAWSFRTGSPPCRLGCRPHQTRPPSAGPSPGVKGHQHVNSMMLTIGPITDRDLTAYGHFNYILYGRICSSFIQSLLIFLIQEVFCILYTSIMKFT